MSVNDTQVGGDHYRGTYQHWDFMLDIDAPCPIVYATKYVFRWRKKNGFQDLEKAIHCVEKAKEAKLYDTCYNDTQKDDMHRFLSSNNVESEDGHIIRLILLGCYDAAITAIQTMLWLEQNHAAEPTSHYVNQGAE